MNKKRMGKHAERIQRFVYKKINKQLISVAGSVLIVLGSYAIVPIQVLATETETATEEAAQIQPNTAALPTVASSELASETPPTTANQEGAAQETPPTTNDDAKAPKETEPKSADEEKKSDESDQQADTAKTRAQPQPRANTTSEGWEYENRGTYVEITDYAGNLVDITVPAKIDGLPVEINLGTVLKEKMANLDEAVTQTFKIESAGEGETPVKVVGTFETLFARSGDPTASYSNNTLISVDFGNADCSEIRDMSSMFGKCTQLQELDLSSWNTSHVQTMEQMFDGCSQLKNLNLTGWDTSNVENMSNMFFRCSQLTDLNLSGWDTSQVQDMFLMFTGSNNLSNLTLSSDFEFKDNTGLRGLPKTTSRWVKDDFAAMYDTTAAFIAAHNNLTETATNHTYTIKTLDNPTAEGWGFDDKGSYMEITSYNGDPTNITVPAKIYGKPVEIDLGTVLKDQMANKDAAPTKKFRIESAGEGETPVKVVGTFKDLFARPMGGGYYSNTTLTSVDFGNADCSEIEDMSYMFAKCTQLQELDLSGWNTSKVENMSGMFYYCEKLQELDVSGWNTSKVENMSTMFFECNQLKDLNLSSWNTSKVRDMDSMFSFCSQLKDLNLSGWNTSKVENMSSMFYMCSRLKDLNFSGWDTSQVQDMGSMFVRCSQLKDLNLSGWNTSKVQDMSGMFLDCSELKELDLTGWNTSNVLDMGWMFYGSNNLSKLTLSSDFEFMNGHWFRELPNPSGKTTYHWVKDNYKADYDSTADFTTAHNNLTGASTNHVYTIKKKYEVSFNLNGGEGNIPASQQVFENQFAEKPDYSEKKGDLIFDGWTLNDEPFSFKTPITEPVELVASWRKARYTIQFDANKGEGTMSDQELSVDEEQQLPANQFTRNGYDFDGWNKESNGGGDSYSDKESVKNLSTTEGVQVKLYAQWNPITYIVTFDTKDGKPTTSKNYTIEKGIDSFGTPTRSGYTFEGWYDGAKKVTKIETGETGSRTLEAKWKLETYKVTFNSKGGTQVSNKEYTVEQGIDSFETPTREHYVFEGWYDGENKVEKIDKGETGNRDLSAKWTAKVYKVTFDSKNGSQVSDKEYTIEKGIEKFETPTRSGYTFEGWYDGEDKVTEIKDGETGNRTLEAKWKLETYTVIFDSNNGSVISPKTYTIEQGINTFETPTRLGYIFEGWYDGQTKVETIPNGETGNRSLEAKWKIETYTVTFDSKNGSAISPMTYTIEKGIDNFETPTRTGYTFEGWYNGEEKVTKIEKGETGNRTLIAKWTPVTYKVTFDSSGGNSIDSMAYTIEETISNLPTPTRKGYKFMGWFEGEKLVTEIPIGGTSDRTLTAKWGAIPYTITFADEGLSPITYTISDQSIALPDGPERAGYRFLGWLVSEEKLNRSTQSTNSIVRSLAAGTIGNLRLSAQYEAITYKVNFDSAGGSAIDPITFTTENAVTKLPEPARIGYRFLGWYDGETKVTELPKGSIGDKNLTAKWEKIKTTEVIEDILKEENQKNRKEQDYTEDSWKNYQEAKKAAEDLLKEVNPDPLKAEQVLAKLQAAIKGLTLKDATAPTPVGTTNIPVSKKVYPTAQAKQYPRTNMITTIWPGFIGTGLVAAVVALVKKNKK
ncbi:InlB B-repeat-containing protein [Enterococcus hulanensis]|uniref:InlB B-repeat-containing protein n=1 Tax=Enterococcus hulanensis TaxID=2559929 RepID=UPI001A937B9B|nr:InlB B-repeat-containing protein [Enterococcus hulanensis]MBO0413545.1 InlB B-repeat-containing protein [Enterococcus hulanensis]